MREPLSIVHSASCRIRQEKDGKYSNDGARDTTLAATAPHCLAAVADGRFNVR
jgi:hypothetical protein